MDSLKFERDITLALKKTEIVKNIPRAARKIATRWAAESVEILKRSAASLQRSGKGRHSANLSKNIAMETRLAGEDLHVAVGTGVGPAKNVIYARIQDEGGTIRKKDKRLTIPLGDTKGIIANFPDGFFVESAAGNVLYCQRVGKRGKLKPLFVLKDEVTLPPTYWFSGPMRRQREDLDRLLEPDYLFMQAEVMATGQGGNGG